MRNEREKTVERVMQMEGIFDTLLAALAEGKNIAGDTELREKYKILLDYYGNGRWLSDYERDERGELPKGLKRGVLSEDGVYDLISALEKGGNEA